MSGRAPNRSGWSSSNDMALWVGSAASLCGLYARTAVPDCAQSKLQPDATPDGPTATDDGHFRHCLKLQPRPSELKGSGPLEVALSIGYHHCRLGKPRRHSELRGAELRCTAVPCAALLCAALRRVPCAQGAPAATAACVHAVAGVDLASRGAGFGSRRDRCDAEDKLEDEAPLPRRSLS